MPNAFGEIGARRILLESAFILCSYTYFSKTGNNLLNIINKATYNTYTKLSDLRKE